MNATLHTVEEALQNLDDFLLERKDIWPMLQEVYEDLTIQGKSAQALVPLNAPGGKRVTILDKLCKDLRDAIAPRGCLDVHYPNRRIYISHSANYPVEMKCVDLEDIPDSLRDLNPGVHVLRVADFKTPAMESDPIDL